MKNLLLSVAAIATSVFVAATPALATYAAQIEQGDIYWAKNVTKGGKFVDPASATCGDTVQFRVRVHNLGPDVAKSVNVKATLPSAVAASHSSTVTITPTNGQPASISDTAGVNLDKAGKLAYVAGSTELLDANGAKMSTLGESIFTSGVNIGDVNISIQNKRFVQFSVKVECDTPQPVKIQVCELSSKNIITIDEKDFDASKHSKDLNDCAPVVEPGKIKVCVTATKEIVTINENDFDSTKHTKDLNACVDTPVVMPTELPRTGMSGGVLAILASLVAAGSVYAVRAVTANKLG